jgi:hypothetical protein
MAAHTVHGDDQCRMLVRDDVDAVLIFLAMPRKRHLR